MIKQILEELVRFIHTPWKDIFDYAGGFLS